MDDYDLSAEIAWIDALPVNSTYDAFTFGHWSRHVLANGTGWTTTRRFGLITIRCN